MVGEEQNADDKQDPLPQLKMIKLPTVLHPLSYNSRHPELPPTELKRKKRKPKIGHRGINRESQKSKSKYITRLITTSLRLSYRYDFPSISYFSILSNFYFIMGKTT